MAADILAIEVVFSAAPRQVTSWQLSVSAGQTVAEVINSHAELSVVRRQFTALRYGVWNKIVDENYVLAAGDRLELYRPLVVDPKVARRERFKQQGAKTAGLFASRRKGAKAGY